MRPKSALFTILKNDGKMRRFRACSQEHDDVGMSQGFHSVAFTDEVSDRVVIFLINFEQFDSHRTFSPCCHIDDSVSSLGDLFP